jgi:5'/3'-nucleotidase SurE
MKYGINVRAPQFFNGRPDLAVAGPNVGNNIGFTVYISGTAGAATYAAQAGIPAIAFSGASGSQTAWNVPRPHYSDVYADLATNLTNQIVAAGTPYLPSNTWLNVNFGAVSDTACTNPADFSFVLSRIHVAIPFITPDDVTTCNRSRLPTEFEVSRTPGCHASVSVGTADTKGDVNATTQAIVLNKLGSLLTCL